MLVLLLLQINMLILSYLHLQMELLRRTILLQLTLELIPTQAHIHLQVQPPVQSFLAVTTLTPSYLLLLMVLQLQVTLYTLLMVQYHSLVLKMETKRLPHTQDLLILLLSKSSRSLPTPRIRLLSTLAHQVLMINTLTPSQVQ